MSRTLTLPKKGTGQWNEGWHECTISKAAYGEWNESKYIDVWFEGYPDNFNMRTYAKIGKNDEEFAIGNLFRFANAGISDALESAEGETIIKMNDDADELVGKQVNVFFYKSGKFTRILNQVAPIEFENVVETISTDDVQYWKGRAEKYFIDRIKPKLETTDEVVEANLEDIPF